MTTPSPPVYFLIVDDLQENLLSLEALLRRDGLVLLKARSGEAALELLLQHEVALALLDVQMPGMDGFELAELMRGTERTRPVPIIFLTAGTTDRQRRFRGYEAGAVDFIQKPIEPDVLRSKADVFFQLYRQRQEIAVQRDELRTYAAALQDADRRKDEFLATLAHELRNPLAPISNGLQILRIAPDRFDADNIRAMMERQVTHLVRLVDDLLDISRISQGKIELRRTRIAMAEVLQSAIEASRPLIEAGGHTLNIEAVETPIWLDGDLTRLAQVASNLLNNAAKYTPAGGRILLSVRRDKADVIISVTDNGIGIPADMLPKVFQLFTQIDKAMDRAQGGLGIGLALVQQLVRLHGGSITADSSGGGQGSTFTVRLPAAPPVAAPEEKSAVTPEVLRPVSAPSEAVLTPPAPLRVLVVDDNFEVAQTVGWMLEMIGHEYEMIHDGREALKAATAFKPDVILLDIGLPGMDGYAVCEAFREDTTFRQALIVAQSGWGREEDRARAAAAGFDHHLVKPVSLDQLEALLSKHVPRK